MHLTNFTVGHPGALRNRNSTYKKKFKENNSHLILPPFDAALI